MVDEAARDTGGTQSGSQGANDGANEGADGAARPEGPYGPPEGFEPPARPGELPGARPWPTLGQEPSGGHPTPEYHPEYRYQGYEAGPEGPPGPRRLYRSERDRVVAGVCGGLRDYLGIDANLLRVAFALLAIFGSGAGLLIYVVLWALVPRESRIGISPTETAMDAVNEVRDRFQRLRRA